VQEAAAPKTILEYAQQEDGIAKLKELFDSDSNIQKAIARGDEEKARATFMPQ